MKHTFKWALTHLNVVIAIASSSDHWDDPTYQAMYPNYRVTRVLVLA